MSLEKYLKAFEKLRVDRAHGIAPHKPILLLSVLQSIAEKTITANRIYITTELVGLFRSLWNSLVVSTHDCKFSLPFYHLSGDHFWRLIPKQGFENILQVRSAMRSFAQLNMAVDFAMLDDELFMLMQDEKSNKILKQFLLDHYFPETKANFSQAEGLQYKLFDDLENKILNEDPEEYRKEITKLMIAKEDEEIFLRGGIFKREVPKIYNNKCCISEMKVDAMINVSMIDACHIIPFSLSFNDTITNGIALCPNLHRAFDRGLIAIDDSYKVLVSKKFQEDKASPYLIKTFIGKEISLPGDTKYFPSLENIAAHRKRFDF